MTTLNDIGLKYGTDKSSLLHNYLPFYEQYLPKNPRKILEIGVDAGASIRMWREYFPEAEVHGLDLFNDKPIPDIEGVTFWEGHQCDLLLLTQLRSLEFDVIIEDCSHNCRDQWITLYGLVDSCNYYFLEDLHTSENPFYQQGLSFEHTVLGSIKSGKFPFNHVLSNDKIVVITKERYANL